MIGNQGLSRASAFSETIVLLSGLVLVASRASAQEYLYNQSSFATGSGPVAAIAADFNGDGRLDLAVANETDNTVSILLGTASGMFGSKADYPAGTSPVALVAADFNGDGRLDLAVADSTANEVAVLLGNGDGSFQSPVYYATGNNPNGIVAADFNGDRKSDLAVSNFSDSTVSILLNNGTGTFKPETSVAVAGKPEGFGEGDFNGDGKPDLVTSEINPSMSYNGTVSVLLSNGNGTFNRVDSSAGAEPGGLAVGDFNRDGRLDVVVANPNSDQATLLLGNGDGSFQKPSSILLNFGPGFVATADFNHDGKFDLLLWGGDGPLSVLLGNGDGTFQPPLDTGFPGTGTAMAIGDFNRDGQLDLAGANSAYGSVCVLLGGAGGTLVNHRDIQLPASYSIGGAASADFNGDGKADLVVAQINQSTDGLLTTLLGNGNGTFQNPISTGIITEGVADILAADFNADGKMDLASVTVSSGAIAVFLGNGNGAFQPAVETATLNPQSITAGDFNNDKKADLAEIEFDSVASTYPLNIVLGNGDGTFESSTLYTFTAPGVPYLTVGDFNHDGILDIAATSSGLVLVFIGKGGGAFASPVTYTTGGTTAYTIVAADFNGDGNLDLAAGTGNGVSFFAGNGDGTFSQSPVNTPYPFSVVFIDAAADFNGDKKPDLAVNEGPATVLLLGNGDGTFGLPLLYETVSLGSAFASGDFNSDGIADLALPNTNLFGQSPPITSIWLSAPTVGLSTSAVSFGSQAVGTSSSPQTVTLTNIGNSPLAVASISASGDFSQTNSCGSTVAIGANCTISITFTPTLPGTLTGTVTIADNAATSPQVIALTGTGTGPEVTLSPASIKFPTQLVGTASKVQTVTLTNMGNAALNITAIATNSAFTETNTCGSSVAAGASCTISVTFKPTKAGSVSGGVQITDNAPVSPQKVTLTGTGTVVELAPSQLNFGKVAVGTASSPMSVTLTNVGATVLDITGVDFAGSDPKDFGETNTCGSSEAAGKSCTFSVTFTPQAAGNRSANLTIKDNGGGSPQGVRLSGTGE